MNTENIKQFMDEGKTLLCVGPMSVNCVDATVEIADEYNVPVMLIASRRQIDDENIKRGYVNNWSTEEFVNYVRDKQKKDNIILARDHGGPWQNNIETEKKLSLKDAINSAKESFARDIDCGFDILHIDPSIDIFKKPSFEDIYERFADLYEFCSNYALKTCKRIEFEIGTEEQIPNINSLSEFGYMLDKVLDFCIKNNFKPPIFAVAQIGTKVTEMKNIGLLNNSKDLDKISTHIKKLCACAKERDIRIKVHNTDYLKTEILKLFSSLNIAAANVAPEFGVCETKSFLELLEKYKLHSLADEFLECAYNSKKWAKWILNGSDISERDKAILAGHYIFSEEKFIKIKEEAQKHIKDIDINNCLKNSVKRNILYYMNCFNILHNGNELSV